MLLNETYRESGRSTPPPRFIRLYVFLSVARFSKKFRQFFGILTIPVFLILHMLNQLKMNFLYILLALIDSTDNL